MNLRNKSNKRQRKKKELNFKNNKNEMTIQIFLDFYRKSDVYCIEK